MKLSESRYRANSKYIKKNIRSINLGFNIKTDADILSKLDSVPNKIGYVKDLIRRDIAAEKKK